MPKVKLKDPNPCTLFKLSSFNADGCSCLFIFRLVLVVPCIFHVFAIIKSVNISILLSFQVDKNFLTSVRDVIALFSSHTAIRQTQRFAKLNLTNLII